jgi:hypothetical protein
MEFEDFIIQNWPPIESQKLAMKDTMSNTFTQYLEFKLQQFCEIDNAMLLREVKYTDVDPRKRLDYLLCGKSEAYPYFFEKKPATSLDWRVCIEAQWGIQADTESKKKIDFIENDFPKLNFFKTTSDNQLKIALAHIETNEQNVKSRFSEIIERLSLQVKDEQKDRYLICLSNLNRRKALFTHAFYDNFVESVYEETYVVF